MDDQSDQVAIEQSSEEIVNGIVKEMVQNIPDHQLDGMAEEHEPEEQRDEDKSEPEAKVPKKITSNSDDQDAAIQPSTSNILEKGASTESSNESSEMDNIYHVKWISWNSNKIPIVTQNSNGPCPMLAIANVLLLRGKMKFQDGCEMISSEQLLEHLGDTMLECMPKNLDPDRRLDYEANVSDAVVLLPKLQTGIDVNVKFSAVSDFEYTSECIIFDLFNIVLYHGWLVDPQQEEIVKAVDGLSYNQLVEKIITHKNSSDNDLINQSLVAQNFLEESASQLTYHGLCELVSTMKDNELAIFFRNNHFSTIYKHKDEVFILVTDQGFLKESSVVWETLGSIDGDSHFVDCDFVTAPPKSSPQPIKGNLGGMNLSPEQQLEQDMQIAKALGGGQQSSNDDQWEAFKEAQLGDTSKFTDEELAMKLQEYEQNVAEQAQTVLSDEELARQLQAEEVNAQEPQRPNPSSSRPQSSPGRSQQSQNSQQSNNNKKCTIL